MTQMTDLSETNILYCKTSLNPLVLFFSYIYVSNNRLSEQFVGYFMWINVAAVMVFLFFIFNFVREPDLNDCNQTTVRVQSKFFSLRFPPPRMKGTFYSNTLILQERSVCICKDIWHLELRDSNYSSYKCAFTYSQIYPGHWVQTN